MLDVTLLQMMFIWSLLRAKRLKLHVGKIREKSQQSQVRLEIARPQSYRVNSVGVRLVQIFHTEGYFGYITGTRWPLRYRNIGDLFM